MTRLKIDHNKCQGCRDCEKHLPNLHELDAKGAIYISDNFLKKNLAKIENALTSCPAHALELFGV